MLHLTWIFPRIRIIPNFSSEFFWERICEREIESEWQAGVEKNLFWLICNPIGKITHTRHWNMKRKAKKKMHQPAMKKEPNRWSHTHAHGIGTWKEKKRTKWTNLRKQQRYWNMKTNKQTNVPIGEHTALKHKSASTFSPYPPSFQSSPP